MVYMSKSTHRTTRINLLTREIKAQWSKSVESLIKVGKCLHQLRSLMDRGAYLKHLHKHFAMSEVHSHRLEQLYLQFGNKASLHVLRAKPSVLYLLASTLEPKKVKQLAEGKKIRVGTKTKGLIDLTVKDVAHIGKKRPPSPFDLDDEEVDQDKLQNAHRHLATAIETLSSWALDLQRYHERGMKIQRRDLLKQYAGEAIRCLKTVEAFL